MAASIKVQRVPLQRLQPSEWNPRLIKDKRFKELCRSIELDPEFLERRPILAQSDGSIYAGNMRYRAVEHLGWTDVPAVIEDVPEQLAKERALRDNLHHGEWHEDQLAEMLAELTVQESELETLGFEPFKLNELLDSVGLLGETDSPEDHWQGMPEYEYNPTAARTIHVHFKTAADVEAFAQAIQQRITEKTSSLWYPERRTLSNGT